MTYDRQFMAESSRSRMSGNDPKRTFAAVIETPMEETSEKPSKSWILGFDRPQISWLSFLYLCGDISLH